MTLARCLAFFLLNKKNVKLRAGLARPKYKYILVLPVEREVGNRGSKSVTTLLINKQQIVKEQRVEGSLCNKLHLRCTLVGF